MGIASPLGIFGKILGEGVIDRPDFSSAGADIEFIVCGQFDGTCFKDNIFRDFEFDNFVVVIFSGYRICSLEKDARMRPVKRLESSKVFFILRVLKLLLLKLVTKNIPEQVCTHRFRKR